MGYTHQDAVGGVMVAVVVVMLPPPQRPLQPSSLSLCPQYYAHHLPLPTRGCPHLPSMLLLLRNSPSYNCSLVYYPNRLVVQGMQCQ